MTPVALAAALLFALCTGAAIFTLGTLWACARLARHIAALRPPAAWPPIVVLRPCEGAEPGLEGNLASSLAAYPGPRHVIILCPSTADASHAVACRVRDAAPPGAVEVVVTHVTGVPNRKSAHLAVGLDHALTADPRPEVIVQADSDVRLDDEALPSLITALGDDPRVAASFSAPIEPDGTSAGDLAASALLSASHQDFFAIAALARLSGGVVSLAGPLAAHRTAPLLETGGFGSLKDVLGEDFEMGRRLMERGLHVEVSAATVSGAADGRSLAEVVDRTTRWTMVVRRQRGALLMASYPLLLAPTPVLLAAGLALLAMGSPWPLVGAVALLGLRAHLARWLRRFHRREISWLEALRLVLAGELLMLWSFPRALASDEVVWRGRRLRIEAGGRIVPLDEAAA